MIKGNIKMKYFSLFIAMIALNLSFHVSAAKLNVPEDFPGTFSMELLGGQLRLGSTFDSPVPVNASGFNILFEAEEFDNVGAGNGSSALTLISTEEWFIGSAMIFGARADFYINGAGTGTLVDNIDSTEGHWTLNTPLHITWSGVDFQFDDFTLSTDACYTWIDETDCGSAMNYETGDAYLVGHHTVQGGDFAGLPITLGFSANDPPVSAVPVPAAIWLFGSGLIGLIGLVRRKKA